MASASIELSPHPLGTQSLSLRELDGGLIALHVTRTSAMVAGGAEITLQLLLTPADCHRLAVVAQMAADSAETEEKSNG